MKLRLASLVLLTALSATPVFGQGCAMCYTGAEAAGEKSQKALNHAVLILLVPTLTLLAGFVGMAYAFNRDKSNTPDS